MDIQRAAGLKAEYMEQLQQAIEEDREDVSIRFVPRNLFYAR